ncbi:hypothetical protein ACFYUJ_31920 [Streptomyces sp. NPDC004520]|uniref:hypothetical protein n=1 Tax=Streptomyces sp. NPDC004520 TaxID=3364702 RepID=UPI003676EBFD
MEIAKLVLDYIKVIIWPGVALFVLLRYRLNISDLIARTRSLSTPAGSLEFAEEVRALRESVEVQEGEAGEPETTPQARADRSVFDTFRDIALMAPETAVMGAWLHVDRTLTTAVDRLYADQGGWRSLASNLRGDYRPLSPAQLARALAEKGWGGEWVGLVDELRRVRNAAAHQTAISPIAARDFVESCEALVLAIDRFVGTR